MLRKDHFIYHYEKGKVIPDCLMKGRHSHYLELAGKMLDAYRNGAGKTRRDLHREVEKVLINVDDCPIRRIHAFCKLLDDVSEFDRDSDGESARLRRFIFENAAPYHPLVRERDRFFETDEETARKEITRLVMESNILTSDFKVKGKKWKNAWNEISGRMYRDVRTFHRLERFEGYDTPQALLSRYNIAQIQASLYFAVEVHIVARNDFKAIVRYAKLAGLMHTIRRIKPGYYRISLNGPASILRRTRLYGAAMACFLPGLFSCKNWKLKARLTMPPSGWQASLQLFSDCGLKSNVSPMNKFDSSVEKRFHEKWGSKKRNGWQIIREGEILEKDQHTFVPDFVFSHDEGRRVYFEIVGFWTPEYLSLKEKTLKKFNDASIILAIQNNLVNKFPGISLPYLTYKTNIKIRDVLDLLEKT